MRFFPHGSGRVDNSEIQDLGKVSGTCVLYLEVVQNHKNQNRLSVYFIQMKVGFILFFKV